MAGNGRHGNRGLDGSLSKKDEEELGILDIPL
jgi:hypothetical protein